jgi:hypothetical protein
VSAPKRLAMSLREFSLGDSSRGTRVSQRKRVHSDGMDDDHRVRSKRVHDAGEDGYDGEGESSEESACEDERSGDGSVLAGVAPGGRVHILPEGVFHEIRDDMRLQQSCFAIVPYIPKERLLGLAQDDDAAQMLMMDGESDDDNDGDSSHSSESENNVVHVSADNMQT